MLALCLMLSVTYHALKFKLCWHNRPGPIAHNLVATEQGVNKVEISIWDMLLKSMVSLHFQLKAYLPCEDRNLNYLWIIKTHDSES